MNSKKIKQAGNLADYHRPIGTRSSEDSELHHFGIPEDEFIEDIDDIHGRDRIEEQEQKNEKDALLRSESRLQSNRLNRKTKTMSSSMDNFRSMRGDLGSPGTKNVEYQKVSGKDDLEFMVSDDEDAIQRIEEGRTKIFNLLSPDRSKKIKRKLTEEEKLHEVRCKDLEKIGSRYLKVELNYEGYKYKPAHHFNSIKDIMPSCIKSLKEKKKKEKKQNHLKAKLKINYKAGRIEKKSPNLSEAGGSGSNHSDDNNTTKTGKSVVSSPLDSRENTSFSGSGSFSRSSGSGSAGPMNFTTIYRHESLMGDHQPHSYKEKRRSRTPTREQTKSGGLTSPKKIRAGEYDENFETVSDRFMIDFDNEDDELEEIEKRKRKQDFTHLYDVINENDMQEQGIEKFNWSGNNVEHRHTFNESKESRTISSLNLQEINIWLTGCKGCFQTSRRYTRKMVQSTGFETLLILCVFLNTLSFAMQGLVSQRIEDYRTIANFIFTNIFSIEMVLKLYGLGFKEYLSDNFNVFDGVVVTISNVELLVNFIVTGTVNPMTSNTSSLSALRSIRIFRIFRVLRVTRLLRSLRFMKVIIEVISGTLEQFMYITLLLFLLIFITSLLGMKIFGGKFTYLQPGEVARQNFDTFQIAFLSVFQILTMENWQDVLYLTMRADVPKFLTSAYLIGWIFFGNYIMLNLVLAVLLEGFESSDSLLSFDETQTEMEEIEKIYAIQVEQMETKKRMKERVLREEEDKLQKIINPENKKTKDELRKEKMMKIISKSMNMKLTSSEEESDEENFFRKHLEQKLQIKKEERDTILVVALNRHGLGRDGRARRTRRALLGDAERGHAEDLQAVGGAQQESARARRKDETGQSSRFPSK